MAAGKPVDVTATVALLLCRYGRAATARLEEPPSPLATRPLLRRGSASSLADAAAVSPEQQDSAGSVVPAREQQRQASAAVTRQPGALARDSSTIFQPLSGRQQQQQSEPEDNVLGTWAGRQRIFSDHIRKQDEAAAAVAAERQARPTPVAPTAVDAVAFAAAAEVRLPAALEQVVSASATEVAAAPATAEASGPPGRQYVPSPVAVLRAPSPASPVTLRPFQLGPGAWQQHQPQQQQEQQRQQQGSGGVATAHLDQEVNDAWRYVGRLAS